MKIRSVLHLIVFATVASVSLSSRIEAASNLELSKTPEQISGTDRDTGIGFRSVLQSPDRVVVEATIGSKQIRAEIDYRRQAVRLRSYGQKISASEIMAFQLLLRVLPSEIPTDARHGDALASFVNLMASAPVEAALDLDTSKRPAAAAGYTPICNEIGSPGVAIYTLLQSGLQHTSVTVGPVCYIAPALGRCGSSAGPDMAAGLRQRFTQECLNHDQCCVATKDRYKRIFGIKVNVCGNSKPECEPEFNAAVNGFFFAPDCGTTAGNWADNFGHGYVLSGGDSKGTDQSFSGVAGSFACDIDAVYNVSGTRTGTSIVFTATYSGGSQSCAAAYTYSGAYSDCSDANGSWTNTAGLSGSWYWFRTNVVSGPRFVSQVSSDVQPTATRP